MRGLYRGAILAVLVAASFAVAAEPSPIRVPTTPIVPPPQPAPGTPLDLTADLIYPVDSDVEFLIFASPDGVVRVAKENGPLRVRGRFVGGTGQVETRTFAGKYLAFVEAPAGVRGDVEVIITPAGAKAEAEAVRQKLRVNGGLGPQPPPLPCPEPKPEPKPDPDPRPAPVSKVAWVVVVEETSARTDAVAAVLNDLVYWKGLSTRGLGWRFYDKDSPDAKAKGYDKITLDKDGKPVPLPRIILLDAQGKNPATGREPVGAALPATTAGIDELIKGAGR